MCTSFFQNGIELTVLASELNDDEQTDASDLRVSEWLKGDLREPSKGKPVY